MSERLGYKSRSILEYTPDIEYVEPDVISEEHEGLYEDPVDPDNTDNFAKAKAVQQLAKNVEKIAESVQEEADELAAGFCVDLNTNTDYPAIMSMRRHFPNDSPSKICYHQYKACKEELRKMANGVSDKVLDSLSEESVDKEMTALNNAFGSSGGGAGGSNLAPLLDLVGPKKTNRPEEDKSTQLIEPIDLAEFQDSILRHLANLLWKNFIKPVIPLPPGVSFLPDEIAPLPKGSPTPEQMMGQE